MTTRRNSSRAHRRARLTGLLTIVATLSLMATGTALATHEGWVPSNAGASIDGNAVVLDTTDAATTPAGTSLENADLDVAIETGDTITFEYVLTEGAVCGGGQPRLFIEVAGVYFNTFDGNDEGDCGELTGHGSTAGTVVATYDGPDGTIGHAGIVFDNITDRGIATITDVQIGGYTLDPSHDEVDAKDECKNGGWKDQGFRNQGQCIRMVNTGQDSR